MWVCKGFGDATKGAASDRFHIAWDDIHPASFPLLGSLMSRHNSMELPSMASRLYTNLRRHRKARIKVHQRSRGEANTLPTAPAISLERPGLLPTARGRCRGAGARRLITFSGRIPWNFGL